MGVPDVGPYIKDMAQHRAGKDHDVSGALNFALYQPLINTMELMSLSKYIAEGIEVRVERDRLLAGAVCAALEGATLWWHAQPGATFRKLSKFLQACKWVQSMSPLQPRGVLTLILAVRHIFHLPVTGKDTELDQASTARMSSFVRGTLPASGINWADWGEGEGEEEEEVRDRLWTPDIAFWVRGGKLGDVDIASSHINEHGSVDIKCVKLRELWMDAKLSRKRKEAAHEQRMAEERRLRRGSALLVSADPGTAVCMYGEDVSAQEALRDTLLDERPNPASASPSARGSGVWSLWDAVRFNPRVTADALGRALLSLRVTHNGFVQSFVLCDAAQANVEGACEHAATKRVPIDLVQVSVDLGIVNSRKLKAQCFDREQLVSFRRNIAAVCVPLMRGCMDSNLHGARVVWTLATFLYGSVEEGKLYATEEWDTAYEDVDTTARAFWRGLDAGLDDHNTCLLYSPMAENDAAHATERTMELLRRWSRRMVSSDGSQSQLRTIMASVEEQRRAKAVADSTAHAIATSRDVWHVLPSIPFSSVLDAFKQMGELKIPSVQTRRLMAWVSCTWGGWCWFALHCSATAQLFVNPYMRPSSPVGSVEGEEGKEEEDVVMDEVEEEGEDSSDGEWEAEEVEEMSIEWPGSLPSLQAMGANAYDLGWGSDIDKPLAGTEEVASPPSSTDPPLTLGKRRGHSGGDGSGNSNGGMVTRGRARRARK